MNKLMFYCQHILGMGHLVRSIEIVKGLTQDFQVCFINGGQIINEFPFPQGVEVINLPAIKTDSEFKQLQVVDSSFTLPEVQEIRKNKLLEVFDSFQPDILMTELYPFGRGKFSFELVPLLEKARSSHVGTKVVCSLRDIVVTKTNRSKYEEKVCKLMNKYFDLLLVHGDPKFVPLSVTFSRIEDLKSPVCYTGYVVQKNLSQPLLNDVEREVIESERPFILVSIGGGRFGHELIDAVVESAPLLAQEIPHQIQVFTGPFFPEAKLNELQILTENSPNLKINRYTQNLLSYMEKADLSISMSGYNTTLNVLTTGVRAMILAFKGNDDQEQSLRAGKLEELGIVKVLDTEDLQPHQFARKITNYLNQTPQKINLDFNGVEKTSLFLKNLITPSKVA